MPTKFPFRSNLTNSSATRGLIERYVQGQYKQQMGLSAFKNLGELIGDENTDPQMREVYHVCLV